MSPRRTRPDLAQGAAVARQVLRQEGYGDLRGIFLDDFARLRGVTVRDVAMTGCEGRLARRNGRAILSVSTEINSLPRRRFVIAHELGHFEVHTDKSNLDLARCSDREISERYDEGPEQEANAFAAELLMPSLIWEAEVDVPEPSLRIVSQLASQFDVSLTAAAIRFVKLSPEQCACVFVKQGVVAWAARSESFTEWIPGRVKVQLGSLVSRYFRKGSVGDGPEWVPRAAWLESNLSSGDEILEDLRAISQDSVLSLLWLPVGEEDDSEE